MNLLSPVSLIDDMLILVSIVFAGLYLASFAAKTARIGSWRLQLRANRALFLFFTAYFGTRVAFYVLVTQIDGLQDTVFPSALFIVLAVYLFGVGAGTATAVLNVVFIGHYLLIPNYSLPFLASTAVSNLLSGAAAVLIGISINNYRDSLRRLNEQLQRLLPIKERVSYILAHDIRNSLAVIRSQGSMLVSGLATPEEVGSTIDAETRQAAHTIDSVLYLAKIDGTHQGIPKERFDIQALCGQVLGSVRLLHPEFTFSYEHRGGSGQVVANQDAVQRMLVNLLNNSVKYSKPHTTIRVETVHEPALWGLRVIDQGAGIPAQKVKAMFQPLTQGSGMSPGVGLGLYIVKTLADLHSATIWVDSVVGKGTTISIEFPIDEESAAE